MMNKEQLKPRTKIVWKNVTSKNPDKKRITDAIRAGAGLPSGKGKVTLTKISKAGDRVCGHVMVAGPRQPGRRTTKSLGYFQVDHPDHSTELGVVHTPPHAERLVSGTLEGE